MPGATGLFCALQLALNRKSDGRVRITASVRHHLDTFASLAASLTQRPTHLAEIVEQDLSLLGANDAAKPGMGGVPMDAWHLPFPASEETFQARQGKTK